MSSQREREAVLLRIDQAFTAASAATAAVAAGGIAPGLGEADAQLYAELPAAVVQEMGQTGVVGVGMAPGGGSGSLQVLHGFVGLSRFFTMASVSPPIPAAMTHALRPSVHTTNTHSLQEPPPAPRRRESPSTPPCRACCPRAPPRWRTGSRAGRCCWTTRGRRRSSSGKRCGRGGGCCGGGCGWRPGRCRRRGTARRCGRGGGRLRIMPGCMRRGGRT